MMRCAYVSDIGTKALASVSLVTSCDNNDPEVEFDKVDVGADEGEGDDGDVIKGEGGRGGGGNDSALDVIVGLSFSRSHCATSSASAALSDRNRWSTVNASKSNSSPPPGKQ